MADVFISYSSKDFASAEYLLNTLESMYLTCWMAPRDIPKGGNFADLIPSAMRNAKIFLILVSQNSQDSVQVRNELTFATHIGLTRIAIHLDNSSYANAFEYHIPTENRYEASGRLVAAARDVIDRIHLELEKQREREIEPDEQELLKKVPLLWLLAVALIALVLILVVYIFHALHLITLSSFIETVFSIFILALLAGSLIRTPLLREGSRFSRKFLDLIRKIVK